MDDSILNCVKNILMARKSPFAFSWSEQNKTTQISSRFHRGFWYLSGFSVAQQVVTPSFAKASQSFAEDSSRFFVLLGFSVV